MVLETLHFQVLDKWRIDPSLAVQVAKLTARLKECEEQLSEAQDCYAKLKSLHQAEKADSATTLATALATKVRF